MLEKGAGGDDGTKEPSVVLDGVCVLEVETYILQRAGAVLSC